jgi:hypothetical protein
MPRLRSGEFAAELAHIVAQAGFEIRMLFRSISLQPFAPEAPCVVGDKIFSAAEMRKIGRPALQMVS